MKEFQSLSHTKWDCKLCRRSRYNNSGIQVVRSTDLGSNFPHPLEKKISLKIKNLSHCYIVINSSEI